MRPVAGFVLLVGLAAATSHARQIATTGATRARGGVVAREESAQSARIGFEWRNPNPVRDRSPDPATFTLSTEIPLDRMRMAIDSFGVTDNLLTLSFTSASDRKKKEAQVRMTMAARGLTFEESTHYVKPSYEWMVAKSRDDLKGTAAAIANLSLEKGRAGAREMVGVFSSFVQNLEYRVPDLYRTNAKGERVLTGGVMMPLEALYQGWGDCDTKSLLFASLLANLPRTSVVFLVGTQHVFVGVQGTPRVNDRYIDIRGIPYVLAEMTTPWALGRIPDQEWNGVNRNLYRIVEIYDNTK